MRTDENSKKYTNIAIFNAMKKLEKSLKEYEITSISEFPSPINGSPRTTSLQKLGVIKKVNNIYKWCGKKNTIKLANKIREHSNDIAMFCNNKSKNKCKDKGKDSSNSDNNSKNISNDKLNEVLNELEGKANESVISNEIVPQMPKINTEDVIRMAFNKIVEIQSDIQHEKAALFDIQMFIRDNQIR